jgi:heme-degrading monooxygenase HmoA
VPQFALAKDTHGAVVFRAAARVSVPELTITMCVTHVADRSILDAIAEAIGKRRGVDYVKIETGEGTGANRQPDYLTITLGRASAPPKDQGSYCEDRANEFSKLSEKVAERLAAERDARGFLSHERTRTVEQPEAVAASTSRPSFELVHGGRTSYVNDLHRRGHHHPYRR